MARPTRGRYGRKTLRFTGGIGESIRATDADLVISSLLDHASKRDVVKLEVLYEASIYALPPNYRSTAGYEHRRSKR